MGIFQGVAQCNFCGLYSDSRRRKLYITKSYSSKIQKAVMCFCFVLSVIFEWFTMRWNARLFFNRFCRPLLQEVVAVFHLVTVSLTEVSRAALFWLARLPQTFFVVVKTSDLNCLLFSRASLHPPEIKPDLGVLVMGLPSLSANAPV